MEESIGSLERVSGHTYDTIYDLVFTTERIIAVIIRHPLDKSYQFGVAAFYFGVRPNSKHSRLERMKIAEHRRRLYKEEAFDELVAGHRFNFEIPYSKVRSVEVTRGLFRSRLKFSISTPSNVEHKIQFTLPKKNTPEVQRLLDQVLPSKIK
jgi:hypothetical protein